MEDWLPGKADHEPETAHPLPQDFKKTWESRSGDVCQCFQILRGLPRVLQSAARATDSQVLWDQVQSYVEFCCTYGYPSHSFGLSIRSSELLDHILACNADRRVFRTERYGALGLGPEGIRSGDIIVTARGAKVPYVLRPATSYRGRMCGSCNRTLDSLLYKGLLYEFVGEAYVGGIMYGEYMDQKPSEEMFCFERWLYVDAQECTE